MNSDWLPFVVLGALVVVAGVLATVAVVRRRRRRLERERQAQVLPDALATLVPLVAQPLGSLVGAIERKLSSLRPLTGPDGTVTLLFSDIVGSVTLNQQEGDDDWVRVLRAHDRIVKTVVTDQGGTVVKTQGDGFMAAFRTPRAAVVSALTIGPALDASDDIGVTLELRMGIHTGSVIDVGDDLHGMNVALAARVAEEAHGREVLVSSEVYDRLHGDAEEDLGFGPLRKRRFKGIPGRQRLYPVTVR